MYSICISSFLSIPAPVALIWKSTYFVEREKLRLNAFLYPNQKNSIKSIDINATKLVHKSCRNNLRTYEKYRK